MDFSLTTLFVVPVGNTLPTTGSTEVLTDGQFGIYKDDARTAATAANVGTAQFIQIAQGRPSLQIGTKVSDKIKASKVKSWYKITGSATAANEIWEVSNFNVKLGEDFTLTLRAHSSYIDTISFNGFTRSITVPSECFVCGDDPCATADPEALVDSIIEKYNQEKAVQGGQTASLTLSSFYDFEKVGSGANTILRISGKPLTKYGNPCDLAAYPWEYDRMWFRVFAYVGPETSVDFLVFDECNVAATTTLIQRSTFTRNTAEEIQQMEKDYYSYQSPFKHLFRLPGYDPYFVSYVTPGTTYDSYVITFDEAFQNNAWNDFVKEDERVIIAVPQGSTTTIEAILTAYLGAPVDESGNTITTTTTTSTSSTTTTSTTVQIP